MENTNNTEVKAVSKMAIARELYKQVNARGAELNGKTQRGRFIELAMAQGLSKHCAGTYYQNLSNEAGGKGLYKYNKSKPTKAQVKEAEQQVLTDIGKHRWMVVDQAGKELNSFESRAKAQEAAKQVEGSKWADRTKAA